MGTLLNGLPLWVKSVAMVGFPIVVALFFMGRETGWIPSVHHRVDTAIAGQAKVLLDHDRRQDEIIGRLTTGLRILCENTASTHADRNNCANIR